MLTQDIGLGLRTTHYLEILETLPKIGFLEALTENYFPLSHLQESGRPWHFLYKMRENYPITFHGVSLNIASTDPLDLNYLKTLKDLISRFDPLWVSDHLCWTGIEGENLHDLLPFPFNEETLKHVSERIHRVQEFLQRPIILENISRYISFTNSSIPEWEFLNILNQTTECEILLDINNIYVNSINLNLDSKELINKISTQAVRQFHLAGYSHGHSGLIDTHDHPVYPPVWKLFKFAVKKLGRKPCVIEWDERIPDFKTLYLEAQKAEKIQWKTVNERKTQPSSNSKMDELANH